MLGLGKSLGQRTSEALLLAAVSSSAFRAEDKTLVPEAVYRLLVAMGECRLFGGDMSALSCLDGRLSFLMCGRLCNHVDDVVEDLSQTLATHILGKLEVAVAKAQAMAQLSGLVEQEIFLLGRLEIWALWLAVNDGEETFLSERAAYNFLGQARRQIDAIDQGMKANARCLAQACQAGFLEAMAGDLVHPYNECLPWWLDGTLSRLAGV